MPLSRPVILFLSALVLAAALVSSLGAGGGGAATPCWKAVVADWYDNGQIDKTYPAHCYREALRNMPEDIRDYTSLGDDLQSALVDSVRSRGDERRTAVSGNGSPTQGGSGTTGTKAKAKHDKGFVRSAVDALGPSGADDVPWPLMVLAAIACALLLGGSAGMIARRLKARRGRLQTP
jgi:hypothetical protein